MEEYWETIYRNTTLVRPTLERHIGVEGTEADSGKRILNCSMINTIGGKYPGALRRPNKGRKYNSNTLKNKNNKSKKLDLIS